jgi:hypothetical protein
VIGRWRTMSERTAKPRATRHCLDTSKGFATQPDKEKRPAVARWPLVVSLAKIKPPPHCEPVPNQSQPFARLQQS